MLTFPYVGTDVSPPVFRRLSSHGKSLSDTDWHLQRVFDGIAGADTQVRANFSRVLSDVNALPTAKTAATGKTSDMAVIADSRNRPVWHGPPRAQEMRNWQSAFFVPYHAALKAHVARVRAQHGHAILVDCVVHRDTTGAPEADYDLAVATKLGISCATDLASNFVARLKTSDLHSAGIDNRFGAGWTVQNCGKPKHGIHALQIRLKAHTFLASVEEPWPYDEPKAEALRDVLGHALDYLRGWVPERKTRSGDYRTG